MRLWVPTGVSEPCPIPKKPCTVDAAESNFQCSRCMKSFITRKQLVTHERRSHGIRAAPRLWAGESAECPVCHTRFSTRTRLIAHLSETRVRYGRHPCRSKLDLFPQIPEAECRRLDELDRLARGAAQRAGHSHPLSTGRPRKASPPPMPAAKRRRLLFKQPVPDLPNPNKRIRRG